MSNPYIHGTYVTDIFNFAVYARRSMVWLKFDININPAAGPAPCLNCEVDETDITVAFRLPRFGGSCTWTQATLKYCGTAYAQYQTKKHKPLSCVLLGRLIGTQIRIDYKESKKHVEEMKSSMILFCLFKIISKVFVGGKYPDDSLTRFQKYK